MTTSVTGTMSKAWSKMDPEVRRKAIGQTTLHLLLVVLSLGSLSMRGKEGVRGPRTLWMIIIPTSIARLREDSAWVFPIGPIAYWMLGRRKTKA